MNKHLVNIVEAWFPESEEIAIISRETLLQLLQKAHNIGKNEHHLSPPPKYTPHDFPDSKQELAARIHMHMDKILEE